MRVEALKKLRVRLEDISFDQDTLLYSARGVTEAQLQAVIEEIMASIDGEADGDSS